MEIAIPKYHFNSILDVSVQDLKSMGAKAVAIDLDNTTLYDSTLRPLEGVDQWINSVKAAGIPMIILSNTYPRRAKKAGKMFGMDYIAFSKKPDTRAFFVAAERLKIDVSELAMIGDRLLADIEGANRAGAISVWVRPFMTEKLFARKFRKIRAHEKELLAKHGIE